MALYHFLSIHSCSWPVRTGVKQRLQISLCSCRTNNYPCFWLLQGTPQLPSWSLLMFSNSPKLHAPREINSRVGRNLMSFMGQKRLLGVMAIFLLYILHNFTIPLWMLSCVTYHRWFCFDRGLGPDDLWRSFATPTTLWSCDSFLPKSVLHGSFPQQP